MGGRNTAELRAETPAQVMLRGAAAGLAATLVLSALSRVLPGLWNERGAPDSDQTPALPTDPFDPKAVQEWQTRSQVPALAQASEEPEAGPPAIHPAGALTQPQGPGPEGLAEQFAFKLASGVFNRDISRQTRAVGMVTHLAYGSAWGVLYGCAQASHWVPPAVFGAGFGMLVYGVGPGWLVPQMGLMATPREEPRERTWMLLAGHLVYGLTVSTVFEALERKGA